MAIDTSKVVVRLSIVQIVDNQYFGETLLEVEELKNVAVERAHAWAQVRGHDRLAEPIDTIFTTEPSPEGFHAVINKPTGLLIYLTWPWVPDHRREPRSIAW